MTDQMTVNSLIRVLLRAQETDPEAYIVSAYTIALVGESKHTTILAGVNPNAPSIEHTVTEP